MNKRFLIALALAAFCGLLAILVARQYLTNELAKEKESSDEMIIAAAVDIPFGTKITAEQLKTISYRQSERPAGSFTNKNEVIGRVALTPIYAQTPVLSQNVVKEGQATNILNDKLREGMRAVSVRVDEASSVAGFAVPGNFVDVIAVLNPGGSARPVSTVILQNIRILANGKQTQVRTDGKDNVVSNTVTLEVSPEQGERLKLAEREGTLQLMLRSTEDSTIAKTTGASTSDIIDRGLIQRANQPNGRSTSATAPLTPQYIAPIPAMWPTLTAGEAANSRVKKTATPEVTPAPTPKAHTVEIIEGTKPRTVQVTP